MGELGRDGHVLGSKECAEGVECLRMVVSGGG
jgi:hypothetical protein